MSSHVQVYPSISNRLCSTPKEIDDPKLTEQKQWLDVEMEKVLEQRKQMEALEKVCDREYLSPLTAELALLLCRFLGCSRKYVKCLFKLIYKYVRFSNNSSSFDWVKLLVLRI